MSEPVQPWQDITGVERTSYLLSLDDEAVEHREALMRMAKLLRTACLVGNAAPIVTKLWQRISNPVPGDLVVECSRAVHRLDYQGMGILLARRNEGPSKYDEAWYIQYGNGSRDIARWENCDVMALSVGVPRW